MCYTIVVQEILQCDRCHRYESVQEVERYKACGLPPDGKRFTKEYVKDCEHGFEVERTVRRRGLDMYCRRCVENMRTLGLNRGIHTIDPTARLKSEGRISDFEQSGDETETQSSSRVERPPRPKRRRARPQQSGPDSESEMSDSTSGGPQSLPRSSNPLRDLIQELDDEEWWTDSLPPIDVPSRPPRPPRPTDPSSLLSMEQSDLTATDSQTGTETLADTQAGTESLTGSRSSDVAQIRKESRTERRFRRLSSDQQANVSRRMSELRDLFWVPPAGKSRRSERLHGGSQSSGSESDSGQPSCSKRPVSIVQSPSVTDVSTNPESLSTAAKEASQSLVSEPEASSAFDQRQSRRSKGKEKHDNGSGSSKLKFWRKR